MQPDPMRKRSNVRPDSKGRITLGDLAKNVSSFTVVELPDGAIRLEPNVEIPAREKWLFGNKEALESVRRGIEQSAKGEVRSLGSFAEHAKDNDK